MKTIDIIAIYLSAINIIGFIAMGIDKRKAKKRSWRTPEKVLIGIAVIGGSIGGILGMGVFHHKTKHKKFCVGLPIILLIQIIIAAVIMFKIK